MERFPRFRHPPFIYSRPCVWYVNYYISQLYSWYFISTDNTNYHFFYLQLFYRNDTNIEQPPFPLTLPQCALNCPLSQFRSLLTPILPVNYEEECKAEDSSFGQKCLHSIHDAMDEVKDAFSHTDTGKYIKLCSSLNEIYPFQIFSLLIIYKTLMHHHIPFLYPP